MNVQIKAKSANEAFDLILKNLNTSGISSAPRGMNIKEILNCCIEIDNPRDRIVGCPERKINMAYAFGELCWYISGRNDLHMMKYYSKFMEKGTDDGKTLNSAYGYRIFKGEHPLIPFNQWDNVKRILSEDKDSRQAIIHLHTPNNMKTNDEVCTLGLQFLVRNDELHMITTMRSNDIFLGFVYDVFAFTMLQELMANELGLKLGKYYHNVGSMHIYENRFYLLDKHTKVEISPMESFEHKLEDFDSIIDIEEKIRIKAEEERNSSHKTRLETMSNLNKAALNQMKLKEQKKDLLFKFATVSFLFKALKELVMEEQLSYSNSWLDLIRNRNENYADVLQYLGGFSDSERKIIVEGMDGAGKTSFAFCLQNDFRNSDSEYQIQHYCKPSIEFSFYNNYVLNLENAYDIIFDRFFISELVYAKVFNRESKITEEQKESLIEMCKTKKCEFILFVAEDENQLNVVANRLKLEDIHIKNRLRDLNKAYVEIAKELARKGCKVDVRGVRTGGAF